MPSEVVAILVDSSALDLPSNEAALAVVAVGHWTASCHDSKSIECSRDCVVPN